MLLREENKDPNGSRSDERRLVVGKDDGPRDDGSTTFVDSVRPNVRAGRA